MVGRDGCFKALSYYLMSAGNGLLYSDLALTGKGPDMTA